ncbi:hypothetical protein SCAR479_13197 [Seiridium cardinale]|uniref:Uncharacterized protein n=1 Tax=Seiridium cardinale TaxID=138064 RepID=A0ABR2X8T1_9PEZI
MASPGGGTVQSPQCEEHNLAYQQSTERYLHLRMSAIASSDTSFQSKSLDGSTRRDCLHNCRDATGNRSKNKADGRQEKNKSSKKMAKSNARHAISTRGPNASSAAATHPAGSEVISPLAVFESVTVWVASSAN